MESGRHSLLDFPSLLSPHPAPGAPAVVGMAAVGLRAPGVNARGEKSLSDQDLCPQERETDPRFSNLSSSNVAPDVGTVAGSEHRAS